MAKASTPSPLNSLADLGKALSEAADDRQKSAEIKGQILDLLGQLDKEDAKALFANETVQALYEQASEERAQSSEDPPGTVYDGMIGNTKVKGLVKKDHTRRDVDAMYPVVTFLPAETIPVIFQGIRYQLVEDQPFTGPSIVQDIYLEHRRLERQKDANAAFYFKKVNHAPDPSIYTPEVARVRGMADVGWYKPGGGPIAGRGEEPERPPRADEK